MKRELTNITQTVSGAWPLATLQLQVHPSPMAFWLFLESSACVRDLALSVPCTVWWKTQQAHWNLLGSFNIKNNTIKNKQTEKHHFLLESFQTHTNAKRAE